MTINFYLTPDDFLIHQLYTASKSELVNKKRRRNRLSVPIIYLIFSLMLFFIGGLSALGGIFILVAILWYVLYPLYSKKRYINHYKKHIEEHYTNRINREVAFTIESDMLYSRDGVSETKIDTQEINQLVELKDQYLVKLKTNQSFIIPKNKVEDKETFRSIFDQIAVEYLDETSWEWK